MHSTAIPHSTPLLSISRYSNNITCLSHEAVHLFIKRTSALWNYLKIKSMVDKNDQNVCNTISHPPLALKSATPLSGQNCYSWEIRLNNNNSKMHQVHLRDPNSKQVYLVYLFSCDRNIAHKQQPPCYSVDSMRLCH